jgi:hypothetical protein
MGRDEQWQQRLHARRHDRVPPIAGGAPEGDPDPDPGDDPTPAPGGDTNPDPEPGSPDPGSEAQRLGRLEAENQRLKREAAAREKEHRKTEAAKKKAEDDRRAQAGEWQKLAEERAGRVGELEAELADLKSSIETDKQRQSVEKTAERLNFRRPKRAFAILADELDADTLAETIGDEQLTEAALKRIARAEPELVDSARRSGAPVNGTGKSGLTPQQRANRMIAGMLSGNVPQE